MAYKVFVVIVQQMQHTLKFPFKYTYIYINIYEMVVELRILDLSSWKMWNICCNGVSAWQESAVPQKRARPTSRTVFNTVTRWK